MIPFNKPFLTGKEIEYIKDAVTSGKISGNGKYTKKCHQFFQEKYDFKKCLLTTSCTDALEMASILLDIKEGDEVIMPSYTFVSTANAFVLRGAKIRFVDSRKDRPGMDENKIEELINKRTKAIVIVHYAGVACNMSKIMNVADEHDLFVVEDAAQAVDSFYVSLDGEKEPLGSIGHLGTFSFHETKNVICGEGGMLAVNDEQFKKRSEIIWEKGTNRSAFFRGEVDKYGWVDVGSSFLPSELNAAFLFAQLEHLDEIQEKRKQLWQTYYQKLKLAERKGFLRLPKIPKCATNNAHMFYVICNSQTDRDKLIAYLKGKGVHSVFHYLSLHKSPYYKKMYKGGGLPLADYYTEHLLRLPLYFELEIAQVEKIAELITSFFNK